MAFARHRRDFGHLVIGRGGFFSLLTIHTLQVQIMAFPIFKDGKILFRNGKPAFSTRCCCNTPKCPFENVVMLDIEVTSGGGPGTFMDGEYMPLEPDLVELGTGVVEDPEELANWSLYVAFETWTDLEPPHGFYRSWYYVFTNCGGDAGADRLISVIQHWMNEVRSPILTVFEAPQSFTLPLTPANVDAGIAETAASDHPGAGMSPKGITKYNQQVDPGCPC